MNTTPDEVLSFWFGDTTDATALAPDDPRVARWFGGTPELDAEIRTRFEPAHQAAASGALDAAWGATARGRLALVIALDQFPRNIYRGSARAFAADPLALARAEAAIADGSAEQLELIERMFLNLPLSHAEDLATQRRAVELAARLLELARTRSPANVAFYESSLRIADRHREIIERFGRFPHRNAVLGRTYTAEEIEFLKEPDSSF